MENVTGLKCNTEDMDYVLEIKFIIIYTVFNMEINGKEAYFIAIKALIRKGDEILITHDIWNQWDLPGGRIKKDEFRKEFQDVLRRKISEELGDKVKYEISKYPKAFFRVQRTEFLEQGGTMNVRIFGIGYEVEYLGGDIILGPHHDKIEWVNINKFDPYLYFKGGWEEGLFEYIKACKEL